MILVTAVAERNINTAAGLTDIRDGKKLGVNMKLLYSTDLHGDRRKYERIFEISKAQGVDIAINGGDLFPKTGNLFRQNEFITGFLEKYFARFEEEKIYYLCYPGNDDLKIFDKLFEDTGSRFEYIVPLAQKKISIGEYEFIGMNWVVDYPFRLKDRCRKDTDNYIFQEQLGPGVLSTEEGYKNIDWFTYAGTLPTIEDELKGLPLPEDFNKAIYIFHMPPANLGLDQCRSGEKVGSAAIYDFLKKNQPLFSLHGHIHESPEMSGKWMAKIGDTVCIQPGQRHGFDYVVIDLKNVKYERFTE
ncbi:MAG: metallophosphoesterase [Elusimicrobiota bacterium]